MVGPGLGNGLYSEYQIEFSPLKAFPSILALTGKFVAYI